jgi:hypothetical protein
MTQRLTTKQPALHRKVLAGFAADEVDQVGLDVEIEDGWFCLGVAGEKAAFLLS